MEMNWQVVVAVLVVGVAVWHLMRRALAVLHAPGRHSCGGCSKCPDPDEKQVTPFELHELGEVSPRASKPAQSIRSTKN